jgi:hypothetical protein
MLIAVLAPLPFVGVAVNHEALVVRDHVPPVQFAGLPVTVAVPLPAAEDGATVDGEIEKDEQIEPPSIDASGPSARFLSIFSVTPFTVSLKSI